MCSSKAKKKKNTKVKTCKLVNCKRKSILLDVIKQYVLFHCEILSKLCNALCNVLHFMILL